MRSTDDIQEARRELEAEEAKLLGFVGERAGDYSPSTSLIRHRLTLLQAKLRALRWVLGEVEGL